MSNEFSQKITEILSLGKEEATRLRSKTINPEHLLLGIIRRGKGSATGGLPQGPWAETVPARQISPSRNVEIFFT